MNSEKKIRVRFAPSPTGELHIGGLRTALFNYLFAKHNNGTFILRIEDTDRTRFVDQATENIIKTLKTLGLDFDEGPGKDGGHGPYYQSERLDIYKKYCDRLLEQGNAYYAFETAEELDEMRKLQELEGKQTMYDRRARDLSKEEIDEKLKSGIPHVIRLKVPLNEEIIIHDIVRGNVKFDTNLVDDQVLLKSDGFPTYHLANVIDDHLMEISHVIRGEEWVTSVPKHIVLYNAFGWEVPKMGHLPLLLNADRTKLSKRQGDVAAEDYIKKGYLKETIINFISLLGWHPGEESGDKEIFSIDELINLFTLEKVHSAGAVFNIDKLNWMNNDYIKNYDLDKLTELLTPYIKEAEYDTSDLDRTKKIVGATRVYLNKLNEIGDHIKIFYTDEAVLEKEEYNDMLSTESSKKVFTALADKIEKLEELKADTWKQSLSEVQKETGVKGKDLFKPVRIALTGSEHGPELPVIAEILGKDKVVIFLRKYI
ncbi:glutamate--tRNA ligase [soil metagenome]